MPFTKSFNAKDFGRLLLSFKNILVVDNFSVKPAVMVPNTSVLERGCVAVIMTVALLHLAIEVLLLDFKFFYFLLSAWAGHQY